MTEVSARDLSPEGCAELHGTGSQCGREIYLFIYLYILMIEVHMPRGRCSMRCSMRQEHRREQEVEKYDAHERGKTKGLCRLLFGAKRMAARGLIQIDSPHGRCCKYRIYRWIAQDAIATDARVRSLKSADSSQCHCHKREGQEALYRQAAHDAARRRPGAFPTGR